MCGIAGFVGPENPKLLKSMLGSLKHRGPDDEASVEFSNLSLGYRRLAVIDLETGNQPFFNEDKSLCLFYNGEIYNFKSLRQKLSSHQFKTQSDGEVIVHGFEEWGEEVFEKLKGMFAVALYDLKSKELFLVRDHLGIKPLYYHFDRPNQRLLFASEIKALLQDSRVSRTPNQKIIYQYLAYRVHDHSQETFFEGIEKLLPGEMMKVGFSGGDGLEIKKKKFWSVSFDGGDAINSVYTKEEMIERFRELLEKSVRLRLVSDVPVGVCLSGGLDSSTISLLIDELAEGTQKTFSAVFPGQKNDEREFIDEVNQKTSAQPHFVYPQSSGLFAELEDLVRVQEEPFISSGPYAQYCVMREASREVKVLLDGQGGDELLAGYDPYFFVYLRNLLQDKRLVLLAREFLAVRGLLSKFVGQRWRQQATTSAVSLLRPEFRGRRNSELPCPPLACARGAGRREFAPSGSNLKQRLYEDVFKYSLPALLRYEDKNSSAFSLESRVPFLDPDLVEFIFGLPEDLIIKNGVNKYILRQAMKDKLPSKIYQRKWKVGFTTPEEVWFRRKEDKVWEIFRSASFRSRPYWDAEKVVKAFERFLQKGEGDSMLFWRFLNTEIWLRVFIDSRR